MTDGAILNGDPAEKLNAYDDAHAYQRRPYNFGWSPVLALTTKVTVEP